MSEWRFIITSEAEADLNALDTQVRKRITEKLKWFRDNFDSVTPFPLGEPWKGFFKFRIGDRRVIYEVDNTDGIVAIHHIGRRDKIYKRRR